MISKLWRNSAAQTRELQLAMGRIIPNEFSIWPQADFIASVARGRGPFRLRTTTPIVAAGSISHETELWRGSLGFSLSEARERVLESWKDDISDGDPFSCELRSSYLNALIELYRAQRAEGNMRTWDRFIWSESGYATVCTITPELDVDTSPTCAWHPSALVASRLNIGRLREYPLVMRNGVYRAIDRTLEWRNDDARTFSSMNDVVSPRACSCIVDANARTLLGCPWVAVLTEPDLM